MSSQYILPYVNYMSIPSISIKIQANQASRQPAHPLMTELWVLDTIISELYKVRWLDYMVHWNSEKAKKVNSLRKHWFLYKNKIELIRLE